jgi:hypothetical protein
MCAKPRLVVLIAVFLTVGAMGAATPPALVNYQGVLRDNNDKPLSGSYDMVFRFIDAATGGNEILLDSHTAAGGVSPVSVTGGLFNVALGSGAVTDGSGPGTYTALDAVFRDYGSVWLEVRIGAETLAPRTRVQSAAYALNATSAATAANASALNGFGSSFFLDTSSTYQIKNGPLRIQNSDPSIAAMSLSCNGTSIGFRSNGCSDYGGLFEAGSSSGTGVVGDNGYYGVRGIGTVGGLFYDPPFYNYAYVGDAPDGGGIAAGGQTRGGFFQTATGNFGDFGYSDRGFYEYGVWSHGKTDGGYFENLSGTWGFVADHLGATIRGNGSKNFEQNHPELDDRTITYSSLEGDEVGTYTRGSGRLVGGEARVALGSTFQFVSNPELGLTVYLTPVGAPARLFVADKSTRELLVKAAPGDPDVAFDYLVVGLRIGFEDANVVRQKEQPSPVPSLAGLYQQQALHPELRATTPRARFETMERTAGRAARTAYPKAAELLAKIRAADQGVTESPSSAHARIPGLEAHQRETAVAGPNLTADRQAVIPALAEATDFMTAEGPIEPGDVVSLDAALPGAVRRSAGAGDALVVGCARTTEAGTAPEGQIAVATSHIVLCRVDATYGAVVVGDRLVASPTPGEAMKAEKAPVDSTVLGRAIDALTSGTGLIRVLVGAK